VVVVVVVKKKRIWKACLQIALKFSCRWTSFSTTEYLNRHSSVYDVLCQSRKGFESPDESGHEVRHDPDTLASSPDRYKGR
jgi:hypothetical protein